MTNQITSRRPRRIAPTNALRSLNWSSQLATLINVLLTLCLAGPANSKITSALPMRRDCSLQSRTWENSVLVAQTGVQNACRLSQNGRASYTGKSATSTASKIPSAAGWFRRAFMPGVFRTARPAQYGKYIIPNTRPAPNHFGRDPPVRLQPSTVYDGSMGYDGTSHFSIADGAAPEGRGNTHHATG